MVFVLSLIDKNVLWQNLKENLDTQRLFSLCSWSVTFAKYKNVSTNKI